jgi:hypothetical protein
MIHDSVRPGLLVAELLAGSWRTAVDPTSLSPDAVEGVARLLLGSGAGPLASRKAPAHEEFRNAFRLSKLHAVIREQETMATYQFLRSRGLAPYIIKGWVNARQYPDPGYRPYGDVDVCLSPEDYQTATAALNDAPSECGTIDLHRPASRQAIRGRSLHKVGDDFMELADRDWDDVVARSVAIPAAGAEIAVLSAEDHLRVLALHYLKHGGYRPLWLCDIAAAVENRAPDFDWDRALGGDPWRARCVRITLLLAHELLGMKLDGIPSDKLSRTPRWLVPTVLREWEQPYRWQSGRPLIGATLLAHPATIFREMARRWPGALESTINLRGPMNDLPRLPLQLAQLVWRLPVIPRQVAGEIRRRRIARRENPERLP